MKRPHTIVIVSNGTLSGSFCSGIRKGDVIVGVDRAAYWLITHKIIPDVAIGDFDSVSPREFAVIKTKVKDVFVYPPDKDWTDIELAVNYALKKSPKELVIFGFTGTRIDHTITSVHVMEKALAKHIKVTMFDKHNQVYVTNTGMKLPRKRKYPYFSIIPLTGAVTVSMTGCAYPLSKTSLSRRRSLGVSNAVTAKLATITIHKGVAAIVRSSD